MLENSFLRKSSCIHHPAYIRLAGGRMWKMFSFTWHLIASECGASCRCHAFCSRLRPIFVLIFSHSVTARRMNKRSSSGKIVWIEIRSKGKCPAKRSGDSKTFPSFRFTLSMHNSITDGTETTHWRFEEKFHFLVQAANIRLSLSWGDGAKKQCHKRHYYLSCFLFPTHANARLCNKFNSEKWLRAAGRSGSIRGMNFVCTIEYALSTLYVESVWFESVRMVEKWQNDQVAYVPRQFRMLNWMT